jgi:hypothetical protein
MAARRRIPFAILALLGAPLVWTSTAFGWQTSFDGGAKLADAATSVAVDHAGDVVIVGTTRHDGDSWDLGVLKFAGKDGKLRWAQALDGTRTPGANSGTALAVAASNDIVAAGAFYDTAPAAWDFGVVKLAGASGTPIWRTAIDGAADDSFVSGEEAAAIALDGNGDVVAGGSIADLTTGIGDFTVVKLGGGSGAELWRARVVGSAPGGLASALAVDAMGDVIAAGLVANGDLTTRSEIAIVRFTGASGAELWRTVIGGNGNGFDHASAVALDAAGDVMVAGRLVQAATGPDFFVAKLSGATGVELWRRTLDGGGTAPRNVDDANALAVDGNGDVLVAGSLQRDANNHFTIVKLAGADGTDRWRQRLDDGDAALHADSAQSVAVDAAGDVLAAGGTRINSGDNRLTIVKLTGVSGNVQWRNDAPSLPGAGRLAVIALDPAGNAVAAGDISQPATDDDVAVLKLNEHLAGKRLKLTDDPAKPQARVLMMQSLGDTFVGAAGSGGDPTVGGALLELRNPTSGEHAEIALPAMGWMATARGYRYVDRSPTPVCPKVQIANTGVRAACKGAGIAYTLNEPTQGTVAVRLRVGSAGPRYCMVFGGTVQHDVGSTMAKGKFQAVNAPPTACPFGSPSGAFVD